MHWWGKNQVAEKCRSAIRTTFETDLRRYGNMGDLRHRQWFPWREFRWWLPKPTCRPRNLRWDLIMRVLRNAMPSRTKEEHKKWRHTPDFDIHLRPETHPNKLTPERGPLHTYQSRIRPGYSADLKSLIGAWTFLTSAGLERMIHFIFQLPSTLPTVYPLSRPGSCPMMRSTNIRLDQTIIRTLDSLWETKCGQCRQIWFVALHLPAGKFFNICIANINSIGGLL